MNGRKSKELRRKAEALTIGREDSYTRGKSKKLNGKWRSQPTLVYKNCTRSVLEQLKKAAKR
jgi:hypothetical protein